MKGFTRDHKFVPMTDYKKITRKSRDPNVKTQGVVIRKQRIVAEGRDTKKHISTEFILAIDNLSRTLDRGKGGLKGLRYNGSMAYWSELKFRADEVSALIKKENVENEIVTAVPQDVINETLRLKRDFDPHDPDFCTSCGKMTGTKDLGMTQECKVCGHAKDIGGVLQ